MDRRDIAYWDRLSTYWSVPPPLSPSADDLAWFSARIAERRDGSRFVLLGATASLARLAWPAATSLAALDWSSGMLRRGLAGARIPRAAGDWRQMPLASGSVDAFAGDGCYSALASEEDARFFTREMHRALRPGGEVWMRCFVQPAGPVDVPALLEELAAARSLDAHLFRWRLAMAVHGPDRFGFALHEVWEAWSRIPDRVLIARRLDWTQAQLERFERWRGETAHYAFPTLERLRAIACERFELVRIDVPAQPLGECFPRLQLRRR